MTTQEIADRLVALSREGKFETAQRELYAPDARSTEPAGAMLPDVQGLDAIIAKGDAFQETLEGVHGITVEGPLVSGDHISLRLLMDVTMKGMGRQTLDEIVVYSVKDGKVSSEQFFYSMGGA